MAPVEGEKRHETFDIANRSRGYIPEQFSVEPGKFTTIKDLPPAEFSIHCEERDKRGFITAENGDPQYLIIIKYRNNDDEIGLFQSPGYIVFSGDQILVIKDRIHDFEIALTHVRKPTPPLELPPGRDPVSA